METGQNGHLGVAVFQTAEKIELESARILHQCLVELIALDKQLNNPHFYVMEGTAVQVTKLTIYLVILKFCSFTYL